MWRHYKGGLYEEVCAAVHTETKEALIVYRGEDGKVWARPVESFHDTVVVDGQVRMRFEKEKPVPPDEEIRDHVKCSEKGCNSIFWRPQDASESLSTADLAQFHGWTVLDREKGLLHCAWGH